MFCQNCGAKISDNAHYCPECGAEIVRPNHIDENQNSDVNSGKSPSAKRKLGLFVVVILIGTIIIFAAATVVFIPGIFSQGLTEVPDSGVGNGSNSDPTGIYSRTQSTMIPTVPTQVQTPNIPNQTPDTAQVRTSSPFPDNSEDSYSHTFEWAYNNTKWAYSVTIPRDVYNYYHNKPHNRESDYSQYALSDYDRTYIQGIVNKFKEYGREERYGEYDTVMMIISFVQSLPYTSDNVTTGYDEYPRYPVETLVDNGGDCEDTAVLTAALLREMGYGSVLLELSDHMAIGVKCSDDYPGTYYEYQGSRYYYLETTSEGWDIGKIPEEYNGENVIIHPMIQVPRMSMSMYAEYKDYDDYYVYYRVHCDIKNIGSGTAYDPVVHIAALAPEEISDKVRSQETVELKDYAEGDSGVAEATVSIPRDSVSRIQCTLYGRDFETIEIYSETFSS